MTEEEPDWARGYDVEELEPAADVFQDHDKEEVLSMFSKVQERDVAKWKDGMNFIHEDGYCIAYEEVTSSRRINDFTRGPRGKLRKGDIYIRRFAVEQDDLGKPTDLLSTVEDLIDGRNAWIRCWQEHPTDRWLMDQLGLEWGLTRISAASELEGVWVQGDVQLDETPPEDKLTLEGLDAGPFDVSDAQDALNKIGKWTGHYSKYGDPDEWSALALRGFGGESGFISKPAEMSQKWRDENPEKMDWVPEDTPLRDRLSELNPLIESIPGRKERIRLMRLTRGDGLIERHADITDPDAGAQFGELMRIHIPLQTNEEVVFRSWNLMGETIEQHFSEGEPFYLDTRKPHAVKNDGAEDRVHLVMDVESNEDLLSMLGIEKRTVGGFF